MRRFIILLVMLFCFAGASPSDALAGNPSPFGRRTPDGMFSVGLQPSVIFNHGTFVFFTDVGYGISPAIAMNAHFGFGSRSFDTYIGGDVRVGIIKSRQVGFDVYAGGHSGGYGSGYDLGAVMNLDIYGALGLVTAIDYDIIKQGNLNTSPAHLVFGIDLALARNMGLLLNAEFGLNGPAYSGISWGMIFFL